MELSEYDFHIIHIPSKQNNIADCLSRVNVLSHDNYEILPQLSLDEFQKAQQKDPEISSCIKYLVADRKTFDVALLGSLKRFRKQLHIKNSILMWKDKYVIPVTLRNRILMLCHDHPTSGHFAKQRTMDRFKVKYFWPNAFDDVSNWVESCSKCNAFNTPKGGYRRAPLQPIESDHRFQIVCYDLAGPFLPVTIRNNRYVLIIVDHFTHWPEFVALAKATVN